MLIRVQSKDGTQRVEVSGTETTKSLFEKVHEAFKLNSYEFILFKTRDTKDKKNEIASSGRKTVNGCKLRHGDMIYLYDTNYKSTNDVNIVVNSQNLRSNSGSQESMDIDSSPSSSTSNGNASGNIAKSSIVEDDIDTLIEKMDGKVERKRNESLCRHAGNSKCIHCSPLDPWDETILREANIKHLSFHSFLRKNLSGVDKGKFTYLEDINCKIKPGCKEHPPWPQGICSKCQPSAVTLKRQEFRHVDNITFENPQIVERFLNYWRITGHQRVGILYGTYHPHLDVPLGIKASVCVIYEPPQEASKDHIKILPDPKEETVEEIAKELGLVCVGWIFTDLYPLDANAGTVKYLRHSGSYFLSASEVITAAYFQNKHPNPCKYSSNGYFGSKIATVIVTGDVDNQIHMEGYQVSNQSQSLVRDECLIPTLDRPELAYVKESTAEQYVPDVYFKEKDQYGNDVVKLGRPLPVEYLLLDCPASTPKNPTYLFTCKENSFPIENRLVEGHLQDFHALAHYLNSFAENKFLEAVSDFHLLIYLATMETLPLKSYLKPLLNAVKNKDDAAAINWKHSEEWATIEQLIEASSGSTSQGSSTNSININSSLAQNSGASSSNSWTCNHCTFINQTVSEICDMCHLPR